MSITGITSNGFTWEEIKETVVNTWNAASTFVINHLKDIHTGFESGGDTFKERVVTVLKTPTGFATIGFMVGTAALISSRNVENKIGKTALIIAGLACWIGTGYVMTAGVAQGWAFTTLL